VVALLLFKIPVLAARKTPAHTAQLDVGGSILMPVKELLKFVRTAPKKVVANHMEALNHCPTTREVLRQVLEKNYLLDKILIPADGETLNF